MVDGPKTTKIPRAKQEGRRALYADKSVSIGFHGPIY